MPVVQPGTAPADPHIQGLTSLSRKFRLESVEKKYGINLSQFIADHSDEGAALKIIYLSHMSDAEMDRFICEIKKIDAKKAEAIEREISNIKSMWNARALELVSQYQADPSPENFRALSQFIDGLPVFANNSVPLKIYDEDGVYITVSRYGNENPYGNISLMIYSNRGTGGMPEIIAEIVLTENNGSIVKKALLNQANPLQIPNFLQNHQNMPFYFEVIDWAREYSSISSCRNIEMSESNASHVPEGTIFVLQKEFVIGSVYENRFIGTFGVGPCIAVVLWHPERSVGMVVHMDNPSDVESSFQRIFDELKELGIDPNEMRAYVIGGISDRSEDLLLRITQCLKTVEIVGMDVLGSGPLTERSFIFNVASGEIIYLNGTVDSFVSQDRWNSTGDRRIAIAIPGTLKIKSKTHFVDKIVDSLSMMQIFRRASE